MAAGRERRSRYALHNDSSATAEVCAALPTDGPDQVVSSLNVRWPRSPRSFARSLGYRRRFADTISRARSLFDHLTGGLYRYADSADSSGAEALRASREGGAPSLGQYVEDVLDHAPRRSKVRHSPSHCSNLSAVQPRSPTSSA